MANKSKTAKCYGMTDDQEKHLRDLVGQVAGKWSLWVLHALMENRAPLRFARLLERLDGVSQKMLTQTLRQLERDGLITRTIYPEVPPRVEYELTADGKELMEQFLPFWLFLAGRIQRFEQARAQFDGTEYIASPELDLPKIVDALNFTVADKATVNA